LTAYSTVLKGLEGVYVTESSLSLIDVENGALYYVGYDVRELTEKASFEEVVFLLLHQRLPSRRELSDFQKLLRESMSLDQTLVEVAGRYAKRTDLLTLLAVLIALRGSGMRGGNYEDVKSGIDIVAKMGALYSTIIRLREGGDYIPPRSDLSLPENMLYMLKGESYNPRHAPILDDLLILHAEHGIPASTFAALVAASTLSDIYSSVATAVLALKGPLHGGAAEAAYRQALEIGAPENVPAWLERTLSAKKRIMGFGHRVYKIYDPRAAMLKEIIARHLSEMRGEARRLYDITSALERHCLSVLGPRGIYPNMDLWTPILYRFIDLPPDSFTAFFSVSRSPGWAAHILEYWRDNKLIRPLHLYVGPPPRGYVPLEARN